MIIYLTEMYWQDHSKYLENRYGKTEYLKSIPILFKTSKYDMDVYVGIEDGNIKIILVYGNENYTYVSYTYGIQTIKDKIPGINRWNRGYVGATEAYKIAKEYVRNL